MSIKRNLGGALNSLNRQVALVLFVLSCAKHPFYLLHLFCHSQPLAIARLATSSLRLSVARPTLSYILPWEGYGQKDNKAYHINHIGDKELEKALDIEEAVFDIGYHLENTVIVGYNVNQFDIPIIKRFCEKYQEPLLYKY